MIDGMVLINKQRGITSHDAVMKAKKILGVEKAGHFGTLDPLAEGLLLIGTGNATKFFDFFVGKNKTYTGTIRFGYATSTYDSEGEMVGEEQAVDLNGMDIGPLIAPFTGKILQYPPRFSAKKHKGIPMYKYARKDVDIRVNPVEVEIFSLDAEIKEKNSLSFKAVTSSGTYLRSLAHDIGRKAGCGAFLSGLTRVAIGEFHLDDAVTLDQLTEMVRSGSEIKKGVIPIEMLLPEFPKIVVSKNGSEMVSNGAMLSLSDILHVSSNENSENYRIFDDDGKLLSIAKKDSFLHRFKPFIVFNNKR